jgi:hypothetical protein
VIVKVYDGEKNIEYGVLVFGIFRIFGTFGTFEDRFEDASSEKIRGFRYEFSMSSMVWF